MSSHRVESDKMQEFATLTAQELHIPTTKANSELEIDASEDREFGYCSPSDSMSFVPSENETSPANEASPLWRTPYPYDDLADGKKPNFVMKTLDVSSSEGTLRSSELTRTQNWFTRWFVDWWGLEFLSWGFSLICMMTIVIVLWKVDGRVKPNWRLGISVDALIAVLSGSTKLCLLMPTAEALGQLKWNWFRKRRKMVDIERLDNASKGTWGSLVLLAHTQGATLTTIGAAIILLSLPFDLFLQQIAKYPTQCILDPLSNATISRAILYDPSPELQYDGGESRIPWDTQLDSFLHPYWLGTGFVPGIQFHCPTGNCTYDPFHTVALDFQCEEIPSAMLEFGCKNTSADWLSKVAYSGPDSNPNVTSCGYYLNIPNNTPRLMSGYEITANKSIGEILATRFFTLSDVWTKELFFDGSINFNDIKNPVVDFVVATTPGGFDGASKNNTPVLTECEIHWVVKKLVATVLNGKLTEEAIETIQFPSHVDTTWNPTDESWYQANFTLTLPDPHSFTGPTSTYGLSNVTAFKVWQVWAEIAPSTYTRPASSKPVESSDVLKIIWTSSPPRLVQVHKPSLPWDTPNNVTAQMSEAVMVMNQVVRRNKLSQRKRHDVAVGKAFRSVVMVQVKWEWVTFSAGLLLIGLGSLLLTVWRSSEDKQKIGIWKRSALPTGFNGLGGRGQKEIDFENKVLKYAKERAKDMQIQL